MVKVCNKKRLIYSMIIHMLLLFLLIILIIYYKLEEIPIPNIEKSKYIYDESDLINEETEISLNSILENFEEQTKMTVIIISIKNLNGRNIDNYATILFDKLDIDSSNSILLVFSETVQTIKIGTNLSHILYNSKCEQIITQYFVKYRNSASYSTAVNLTIHCILTVLSNEYGIYIEGLQSVPIITPQTLDGHIVLITLLFLIFAFVSTLIINLFTEFFQTRKKRQE